MAWDKLSLELQVLTVEIQEAIGFNPIWIGLPFVLLFLIIAAVKVAAAFRKWWIRPYASSSKLLIQLAKLRGLSNRQIRVLRLANPGASYLVYSQMLLDPAAWPSERRSQREKALYESLFREQLESQDLV